MAPDDPLAMQSTSTYVYEPLDPRRAEIRVLRLSQSKTPEASLEGRLETVSLDASPLYESLSYVWGQDSSASQPLHIGATTLQITSSLECALRALREPYTPLRLWVDRVCINQDDLEERNLQVQLMRRIFTHASHVNIWLGEEFEGARDAYNTLQRLAAGMPLSAILQSSRVVPKDHVERLTNMFRYPWWKRLWTIQEALLAKRAFIRCGSRSVDLETVMQSFELLWNQLMQEAQLLGQLCGPTTLLILTRQLEITIRRLHVTRSLVLVRMPGQERKFRDDPLSWPMVMHNCAWSYATDHRDKVYGTLGLFPSSFLTVDYSLSLRETYSRTTLTMIKRLDNLAVLTQTVSQVSIDNDLPSWVPDWRHPAKETASLLVFYSFFRAGLHLCLDAVMLEDETLRLSAQHIDEIVDIGELYDDLGSETASNLSSLLKPTIKDWIRLGQVPEPPNGSFLAHYTKRQEPFAMNTSPARAQPLHTAERTHVNESAGKDMPIQLPQSHRAPVYKDVGYTAAGVDHGVKRKIDDSTYYMPQQSQSAPIYKDAAYSRAPPNSMQMPPIRASDPRAYDPFSHTYGPSNSFRSAAHTTVTRQAQEHGRIYSGTTLISEAFWRTLCMDIVEDRELKKHRRCKSSDGWRVWEWIDWILEPDGQRTTIPQLHWHLTTQLQGKRMVKTKLGYIALAGRDVRAGDQVWIFAGGAYPYVLREDVLREDDDAADERTFRCVSTMYVHGLMDGRKSDRVVRPIKIR